MKGKWSIVAPFLIVLLCLSAFLNQVRADEKPAMIVEPRTVARMIENRNEVVFINTASVLECMDSRIPSSVCVACAEGMEKKGLLPENKRVRLVFYDGNSTVDTGCGVIREAQEQGFSRIYLLKGGMTAWKRAGYEVESPVRIPRIKGPAVKPENLRKWLDENPETILIDLRNNSDFQANHLSGAVNMPMASLHKTCRDLPRNSPLLLIDEDGSRSFLATSYLRRKGVKNVGRLEGGMAAWRAWDNRGRP